MDKFVVCTVLNPNWWWKVQLYCIKLLWIIYNWRCINIFDLILFDSWWQVMKCKCDIGAKLLLPSVMIEGVKDKLTKWGAMLCWWMLRMFYLEDLGCMIRMEFSLDEKDCTYTLVTDEKIITFYPTKLVPPKKGLRSWVMMESLQVKHIYRENTNRTWIRGWTV